MNLKYKIENDNILIYNELDEIVMLTDLEKEKVLKNIELINSCDIEIQKCNSNIIKLKTKSKYSSIVVMICSILTSLCLFFNNPLNLGLLSLTLTSGGLIMFFAFEDERLKQSKLAIFHKKRKKLIESDLNKFLSQMYNSLNNEIVDDNLKARYVKSVSEDKNKYNFVCLSKVNSQENFNKDLLNSKYKVKRMVKHK